MSNAPAAENVVMIKCHLLTLEQLKAGVNPKEALQQIPKGKDRDYYYHTEVYSTQVREKTKVHDKSKCQ